MGKSLFFNSTMEACIVICRSEKPKNRQGKILFIQAVNEVTLERTQAFLRPVHQSKILMAYRSFADDSGFARVCTNKHIANEGFNLSIQRYIGPDTESVDAGNERSLDEIWSEFESSKESFWEGMDELQETLDAVAREVAE